MAYKFQIDGILILQWGSFIVALILLLYTAIVVRNEKKDFYERSCPFYFASFRFLRPPWWSLVLENDQRLEFMRTDTRYEWKALIEILPLKNLKNLKLDLTLVDLLDQQLENEEIIYDPENIILYNKEDLLHLSPQLGPILEDAIRIEGTGTKSQCERIYLDLIYLKDKRNGNIIRCSSLSSVLNGSIEGPYFEEMIKGLLPI